MPDFPRACFCVGPQNGQPVCPCRMRNVRRRNGRLVEERDLGPASDERFERFRKRIEAIRDSST
jgi:hypothetical protein